MIEYSVKEIADLCGYSKTSVNRAIKELGIESTTRGNKNVISGADAEKISLLLRGFGLNENKTAPNQTATNPNQATINPNQTTTENDLQSSSTEKTEIKKSDDKMLDFLLEQIKIKDLQIQNLQNENQMLIQSQAYTLKQLEELKRIEQTPEPEPEQAQPQEKKKKGLFGLFRK